MANILEIAGPQARILTPVPAPGPGICRVCRGCPNPGWPVCYSCSQAMGQVSRPCRIVVPLSLYRTPSQLWSVLRGYKDNPDPAVQERFSLQVAAFLGVLLVHHGDCIREHAGEWDTVTTVPSTSGQRTGPHPLAQAVARLAGLKDRCETLLAAGPVKVGHNHADDEGFVTTGPVEGRSVLVVDDTYTSGARAQSAASALQLAGAEVPAIVVVGRVINPEFGPHVAEVWDRQCELAREHGFAFDVCALEAEEPTDDDEWVETF